jgi:hypothetical protein
MHGRSGGVREQGLSVAASLLLLIASMPLRQSRVTSPSPRDDHVGRAGRLELSDICPLLTPMVLKLRTVVRLSLFLILVAPLLATSKASSAPSSVLRGTEAEKQFIQHRAAENRRALMKQYEATFSSHKNSEMERRAALYRALDLLALQSDVLPVLPSFIRRVCSGLL